MQSLTFGEAVECDTLYTILQPIKDWRIKISFASGWHTGGDYHVVDVTPEGLDVRLYGVGDRETHLFERIIHVPWIRIDSVKVY